MTATADTCTAFLGARRLATGPRPQVAAAVKRELEADPGAPILVFDDRTGQPVDFDLRGTEHEVAARLSPAPAEDQAPRGRGRPRLGVVAREVTLLPRHWEWLAGQPGGASVALRKLVEAARSNRRGDDLIRTAQEAAGRVMLALAGDRPGYEEATRALYARDAGRFAALVEDWPKDVRDHVLGLAAPAFSP